MGNLSAQQRRTIELQRQLKIAKVRIASGCRDPEGVASDASLRMWPLEPKQPLQGVVGHGK